MLSASRCSPDAVDLQGLHWTIIVMPNKGAGHDSKVTSHVRVKAEVVGFPTVVSD